MRSAHFVKPEVPEQWRRFIRSLESPCEAPRVPLMAERPPEDFVARPRGYGALRARLLDPARQEPVAVTAALLWATLGEQPGDLGTKVEDLVVALSGEPSRLASLEARRSRLAELLADRSVLLVVDDVWNRAHLEPFLVGGPRCGQWRLRQMDGGRCRGRGTGR
jgi:hypothetical protein